MAIKLPAVGNPCGYDKTLEAEDHHREPGGTERVNGVELPFEWWDIGMVLIFGHFALPFLVLLRIDAKLTLPVMIPLCGWAWAMHFCDLSFNIMPVIHPRNFWLDWRDLACLAFIGGVLGLVFARYFNAHPPYPIKDPRLGESLGVHHVGARGPAALTE